MAGESRFRAWLNRMTGTESQAQDTTEQNAANPVMDAVLHEFNTQLGASYLNMISRGSSQTAPYSTEQIIRMAQEPMRYISELRQWARWAYYSNGTVGTAIDALTSLHSLDYIVTARPKRAGVQRKGYRTSADRMNSVLRSMRYKEVIRDAIFHNANEGMYVGYMETRTVPVERKLTLTDMDINGISEINSSGINTVVIPPP